MLTIDNLHDLKRNHILSKPITIRTINIRFTTVRYYSLMTYNLSNYRIICLPVLSNDIFLHLKVMHMWNIGCLLNAFQV
jgi:hypothetical protein